MFQQIVAGDWPADRTAILSATTSVSWSALSQAVRSSSLTRLNLARRRVGFRFRVTAQALAALGELDALDADVFLMDGRLGDEDSLRLAKELRLGALLVESSQPTDSPWQLIPLEDESPGSGQSSVTILTSGTTGKPKAARHTWQSLTRPIRVGDHDTAPIWLLTYLPHLYAGLQVLLQCLANGGSLVVPDDDTSPVAIAELMRKGRTEYVSATPSYWRRLLLFADTKTLTEVPVRQITLGGEAVDQQILDSLRRTFPSARITHIYATTELGRCFAVTDGRAGFPSKYLREPTPDGVELQIEDSELIVRSANAMLGYDHLSGQRAVHGTRGYRTGDLVEVVGDRVFFVGRRTDMINVGGNKVYPIEVERVVRAVRGVADTRIYGRKSSIAGELVCCQVVPIEGVDIVALRQDLSAACLEQLTPTQRPRLIDIVAEIGLDRSGKVNRRQNQ